MFFERRSGYDITEDGLLDTEVPLNLGDEFVEQGAKLGAWSALGSHPDQGGAWIKLVAVLSADQIVTRLIGTSHQSTKGMSASRFYRAPFPRT